MKSERPRPSLELFGRGWGRGRRQEQLPQAAPEVHRRHGSGRGPLSSSGCGMEMIIKCSEDRNSYLVVPGCEGLNWICGVFCRRDGKNDGMRRPRVACTVRIYVWKLRRSWHISG